MRGSDRAGADPPAPGDGEREVRRLVAMAQGGDVAAFEQLYRRFAGQVHAVCLRLVAEPETATRLTQDAFVRAWQRLSSYRGEGAFGGWLRRLTVNVVVEDRRGERRRLRLLEPLEGKSGAAGATEVPDPAGPSVPGGGQPTRAETALDLERAVAGLPAGARLAFVLHDVEGYRHREIAQMTGLAVGTIKAQLHRARRLLRRALTEGPEVSET